MEDYYAYAGKENIHSIGIREVARFFYSVIEDLKNRQIHVCIN